LEIDGSVHGHPDQIRHDARRDEWLAERGIRTLRIPSSWTKSPAAVLGMILEELQRPSPPLAGVRMAAKSLAATGLTPSVTP
jgi:very-short-patch-repair endonuclease